jgi:hypothetical protein
MPPAANDFGIVLDGRDVREGQFEAAAKRPELV